MWPMEECLLVFTAKGSSSPTLPYITLHELLGVSQCVNRVWDAHFYALVFSHLYLCSARITGVRHYAWLMGCWGLNPGFQSC